MLDSVLDRTATEENTKIEAHVVLNLKKFLNTNLMGNSPSFPMVTNATPYDQRFRSYEFLKADCTTEKPFCTD